MERKIENHLIASGIIYSIIVAIWPVLMVLSPSATGSIEEQLHLVLENSFMYKLGFVVASLIGPALYYIIHYSFYWVTYG